MTLIDAFGRWLGPRALAGDTTTRTVHGLPVVVHNTRPDVETEDVLARLDGALGLIDRHTPHHFRRLRRDFAGILVQRYACRGAYLPGERICLVELTFTVNRSFSLAQIAATILHEAMHARLDRLGFSLERGDRARQERFCRRAEVEFGTLVPGGEPIVERALAALHAADADVAPRVDARLAAHRVAQADLDALAAPRWLKRAIARRHGLTA